MEDVVRCVCYMEDEFYFYVYIINNQRKKFYAWRYKFFSQIFAGFQTVPLCPVVSIPWKTLIVQVLITSTFGKIIIKFGEMSHIFLSLPPRL